MAQAIDLLIRNGTVLGPDGALTAQDVAVSGTNIVAVGPNLKAPGAVVLDAGGLMVLPGIVDLHGDAFERQLMPRPGVHFPPELALADTDRQLVASGITTAFHAITLSWEPGLRGVENMTALVEAIVAVRPSLSVDTRIHLRFETYNLDAIPLVEQWIRDGHIELLAFNDHAPGMVPEAQKPGGLSKYAQRTGLTEAGFAELLNSIIARADEVPAALDHLATIGRAHNLPMASHDDDTPEIRAVYAARGCGICEFPKNTVTAQSAIDMGAATIMGAPNVVRGGSHLGLVSAASLVGQGLCTVLGSDYFYPALLAAPFRLARDGVTDFARAWALVSTNPARAAGLHDRGTIAEGQRADIVLVEQRDNLARAAATLAAGRVVHLADDRVLRPLPAAAQ